MNRVWIGTSLTLASGIALAQPTLPPSAADIAAPPPLSAQQAPVALLVDQASGQTLYERGASKPFLPASMTKAMTLLVAFDLIAQGKLREDQLLAVRPETAARWSGKGTSLYLHSGMQIAVKDLLLGISTASANDASVVLAEGAAGSESGWLELMNARATALQMTGSRFGSPNGWPDGGRTQVTARDLARLARAIVADHPQLYARYIGKSAIVWNGATFRNHDPFAGAVAGADGIKTGHTTEAGYNFLGSVQRGGRRLTVVVAGMPSEAARAKASRDLIEWGYAAWHSRAVAPRGAIVGRAAVQDGAQRSVPLALSAPLTVALRPAGRAALRTQIRFTGPLRAPIAKGAVVAELYVTVDGGAPATFPLQAAQAIAQAGPLARVRNGVMGVFE